MTRVLPTAVVVLPTELDLTTVTEVRGRFLEALASRTVTLDGTQIQRIDTAGIQLLCALVRAAEHRGVTLAWTAVSPTLVTCVYLHGVGGVVRLDGVKQEGLEWFE